MRRPTLVLATTTCVAALLVGVPDPASAASGQFGNTCTAGNAGPGTIIMTGAAPGNAVPVQAPFSGVITKATFTVPGAAPPLFPTVVKVVRATGPVNQYRVVAQSPVLNVTNTVATYDVRLPVSAGDLLGIYGGGSTLVCTSAPPGDTIATLATDAPVGSTATYTPAAGAAVPLVATVEPDADGDGYGDLTQDLCLRSAVTQVACPVLKLDSLAAPAGRTIKVIVATSTSTTVSVTGVAKVGGKKLSLTAKSRTVEAGSLAQFKVKLPKALKAALAALPPSKSIKVTLTTSGADVTGQVTTDSTKVKLPGTRG